MSPHEYYLLIHKALSGEINEDEEKLLSSWLKEDSANQQIMDDLRGIWDTALDTEGFNTPDETRLQQQRERFYKNLERAKRDESARFKSAIVYRNVAVIILFIISITSIVALIVQSHLGDSVTMSFDRNQTLVLPDSSLVSLNKDSKLTFTESWNERSVKFQGEGFFRVSKIKNKPFNILLPNGSIKVLGTSFFVRAYPDDTTEVWVSSGTVEVRSNNKKVILSKGESSTLLYSNDTIIKAPIEDQNFNSWYTGKLQFEKTKFRKIIKLLEGQYHIKFQVSNPQLMNCRFTGTFEDEALDTVLKVLSQSMGFSFRLQDGIYIIEGKGCRT